VNTIDPHLTMATIVTLHHAGSAHLLVAARKIGPAPLAAIEAMVLAVAAGFALIVVATVVVIIGIHQEERRKTILRGRRPPTACALLARWVMGAHFYLIPEERPQAEEDPGEEPPWFERPSPPTRPIGPRGR
jgi:hypothetical protein